MPSSLLFLLFACCCTIYGATVNFQLTLSNGTISPDGVLKNSLLVNNQMPGPPINVMLNDLLVLDIINNFHDGVSIHLHGVDQIGTPFYDGAAGISQRVIGSGKSMQLQVQMTSSGTYFYHAHYALYDMTVFGALIIHDTTDVIDNERVIILNDLWHADVNDLLQGLMAEPFKRIGDAASILTNGVSRFLPCVSKTSTLPCASSVPDFALIEVEQNQTYRLRIINAATSGYFTYAIANHNLTIIEVDGALVQPYVVDHLEINSGQRYSVLVTTDKDPQDYWMNTQVRYRPAGPLNGQSILRYASRSGFSIPSVGNATLPVLPTETPGWILNNLRQLVPDIPQQQIADQIFTLVNQQSVSPAGLTKWALNNITFVALKDQPMLQYAYENRLSELPSESRPIPVKLGSLVDIILINTVKPNGVCEEHPWHLHGQSFWVLGRGNGSYSPLLFSSLNLEDPVSRDTETLYPYIGASFQPKSVYGKECGWLYLRWRADNPGIWPFHCHFGSHVSLGMMTAFSVGEVSELPALPVGFRFSDASSDYSNGSTTNATNGGYGSAGTKVGLTLAPAFFAIILTALVI